MEVVTLLAVTLGAGLGAVCGVKEVLESVGWPFFNDMLYVLVKAWQLYNG